MYRDFHTAVLRSTEPLQVKRFLTERRDRKTGPCCECRATARSRQSLTDCGLAMAGVSGGLSEILCDCEGPPRRARNKHRASTYINVKIDGAILSGRCRYISLYIMVLDVQLSAHESRNYRTNKANAKLRGLRMSIGLKGRFVSNAAVCWQPWDRLRARKRVHLRPANLSSAWPIGFSR